jgi:hypothetical protein
MYSKNGSIPKEQTDGTEGWIDVPNPPEVPDGKELVWLNWEWVVRDPKPVDRLGYQWNWNHSEMAWVESPYGNEVVIIQPEETVIELGSAMPSAGPIMASAGPV